MQKSETSFYSEVISLTVFCSVLLWSIVQISSTASSSRLGSCSEGGTAAGESDGIAGAPSCFQLYIQVTEWICVSLIDCEIYIYILCGVYWTKTDLYFSLSWALQVAFQTWISECDQNAYYYNHYHHFQQTESPTLSFHPWNYAKSMAIFHYLPPKDKKNWTFLWWTNTCFILLKAVIFKLLCCPFLI